MERAAAGETFLITRRGKPYARLFPPSEQLDLPAPGSDIARVDRDIDNSDLDPPDSPEIIAA